MSQWLIFSFKRPLQECTFKDSLHKLFVQSPKVQEPIPKTHTAKNTKKAQKNPKANPKIKCYPNPINT